MEKQNVIEPKTELLNNQLLLIIQIAGYTYPPRKTI